MKNRADSSYLSWSAHSDMGRRSSNEDRFLIVSTDSQEAFYLGKVGSQIEIEPSADYIFAVSDGMGGAMGGEFASHLVVEKIMKMAPLFSRLHGKSLECDTQEESGFHFLRILAQEIHRALLLLGASDLECRAMGATLTLCWFHAKRLYFLHVGDSRLYHLPEEGGIKQLSEDDTHVGWLLRQSMITEYESKNHPRRHLLQKALGGEHQFLYPQVYGRLLKR